MGPLHVALLCGLLTPVALAHRHLLAAEPPPEASNLLPDSLENEILDPWSISTPAMEEVILPGASLEGTMATQSPEPRVISSVGPATGATQLQPDDAIPLLSFPGSDTGVGTPAAAANAGVMAPAGRSRAQPPPAPPAKIGKHSSYYKT